jgi:predicted MFS family arabinose efflux permease
MRIDWLNWLPTREPRVDSKLRDYAVITGNYWAFTLTDGALRMLVVLHFHTLGFTPFEIASLFLFYEFFGIVTNAVGGWLGARIGLNRTMQIGLLMQIGALSMLLVPEHMLTVVWVMVAQALSGIAKDLNKMSAKSSMKSIASDQNDGLYRIVAFLTGSKNALKGAGFFIGAVLLSLFEFQGAVTAMVSMLTIVWVLSLLLLRQELGVMENKPKFNQIFSKSRAVNWLSLARFFLFGARDVWFVVALPVFLHQTLQWDFWQVGGYLASWIIIYGFIQAAAPKLTGKDKTPQAVRSQLVLFGGLLALVPAGIAMALVYELSVVYVVTIGLLLFALLFAMNSALHSYLIVRFARTEGASLDIGFYYMANAGGRLAGTIASGALFQWVGLEACLWVSALLIAFASITALSLPREEEGTA